MITQYTAEQLQSFNRTQLWAICKQHGLKCYPKSADCVEAILNNQPQKIQTEEIESQPLTHNSQPSETEINFIDIDGFYNFEATVNGKVVAEISHDAFNEVQSWFVSVSGMEVYRSTLYSEVTDWVKAQYADGTLPNPESYDVLVMAVTLAQRASSIDVLEQHGSEFVVHNCENDHYYVVRPKLSDPHERCECPDCHYRGVKCKHQIAVENFIQRQNLEASITATIDVHVVPENPSCGNISDLLDKPFDELTKSEWDMLMIQLPHELVALPPGTPARVLHS
ncbi:MAG: hypothetical protein KME60_24085 [Cyanomargarita calcarea GSE-NOS-MK-12-04C]|uniref:SWIM-type domain-containing protein n=1 Tax=Cyanomargarita calcarea GSE-NOS-MK-12-04C TaxID=2839659 RepID=A0A951UU68_9CYAN|nr:hypothetical protein [Cyanomargarita calcarea GSE-NOS-MK-12-04C]